MLEIQKMSLSGSDTSKSGYAKIIARWETCYNSLLQLPEEVKLHSSEDKERYNKELLRLTANVMRAFLVTYKELRLIDQVGWDTYRCDDIIDTEYGDYLPSTFRALLDLNPIASMFDANTDAEAAMASIKVQKLSVLENIIQSIDVSKLKSGDITHAQGNAIRNYCECVVWKHAEFYGLVMADEVPKPVSLQTAEKQDLKTQIREGYQQSIISVSRVRVLLDAIKLEDLANGDYSAYVKLRELVQGDMKTLASQMEYLRDCVQVLVEM